MLSAHHPDLLDLAPPKHPPSLVEATTGKPTGIKLLRHIGAGGMAAVFLAECDEAQRSDDLSDATPRRLAVKIMKPSIVKRLEMRRTPGRSHEIVFVREAVALGRMMEQSPRSEFV